MLAIEDNERVTRVGPGTPMGDTMRRYWMPALLAWELPEPDCPPGARQAARRGARGVPRHARGASGSSTSAVRTAAPRSSSAATRTAACAASTTAGSSTSTATASTMMNEPEELSFAHKIRTTAYPTVEAGGVIWAYIGPPTLRPPLPPLRVDAGRRPRTGTSPRSSRSATGSRGSRAASTPRTPRVLHRVLSADATRPGFKPGGPVRARQGADARASTSPTTAIGTPASGSSRAATCTSAPITSSLPFHQIRPGRTGVGDCTGVAGHIWVPMDDDTTMVYNWGHSTTEPLTGRGSPRAPPRQRPARRRPDDVPLAQEPRRTTTCWIAGCSAPRRFTGIDGVNVQDRAVQESMGTIVDRSLEHLGPADKAIIQARRLLLQATRTVRGRRHAARRRADVLHATAGGGGGAARDGLAHAPRSRGARAGGPAAGVAARSSRAYRRLDADRHDRHT